jgi:hypothetical protein
MSLGLAKEMAAHAYDLFMDSVIDFVLKHGGEPNVVYVSQAMESILIGHLTMNCNVHFPIGGVRGMSHIMGMRPVWDALHFKLEREECRSTQPSPPSTMSSPLSFSISAEVLSTGGSFVDLA